jgi:ribonuclease H / adenosylcobalamin/alpha-ribazole phosphatase
VTAQIMLIRHAAHSHLGNVLSGRTPGLGLSAAGCVQAARLARHCAVLGIDRLESSPIQRAQETAQAIADQCGGLAVETASELDELDFGEWAGRSFADLDRDPRWLAWNASRQTAVAPAGESMADAQARAMAHIERVAAERPGQTVAMVTHCDIIRAVIAKVLGLSLDHILRFDVDPASTSRLAVGAWGAKVLSMNETCPGVLGQ